MLCSLETRENKQRKRFFEGNAVGVLLPLPLAGPYDYRIPAGVEAAEGDFVEVPLRQRTLPGVIWNGTSDLRDTAKLKMVTRMLPVPPLPAVLKSFVDWVADYTVQPQGSVLRMVMNVPEALTPLVPVHAVRLASAKPTMKWSPARERVISVLSLESPLRPAELASKAQCTAAVIRGLISIGALESVPLAPGPFQMPDWRLKGRSLSEQQATVSMTLRSIVGKGFAVEVLDGVPGAGKTDVYFEAIAQALQQDQQVLVLLPEIALGAQWRSRFAARFGTLPQEWHSDLTRVQRRRTWRAVAEGQERLIVGARSALFLPFPELGLIVVDEEHDSSFKQEDGVAYHARDMAVARSKLGNFPCILVSATPSLETIMNVRAGRYRTSLLPDRATGAAPPAVEIVDLRRHAPPKDAFVAPLVRDALQETLAEGRQALLFLNRRGYAPLTLCRLCGHRLRCASCAAWLVEHRLLGTLLCHHCGYKQRPLTCCPECGSADTLRACGPGVERLAEEVASFLPDARILITTSDTLTGPNAADEMVARIERHAVDVIIGTQLVAKGYHFSLLKLVAVVDADMALGGNDLRAAERTFQLLYQVGGRAGRETKDGQGKGRVLLQTASPSHPVMLGLASGDRAEFLAAEEANRRASRMPPFGRLAAIIVSGREEGQAEAAARLLANNAQLPDGVRLFGPAPAPLALLRGRYRHRLLVSAPRSFRLSCWVREWVASVHLHRSVQLQIDIDPQSFL